MAVALILAAVIVVIAASATRRAALGCTNIRATIDRWAPASDRFGQDDFVRAAC